MEGSCGTDCYGLYFNIGLFDGCLVPSIRDGQLSVRGVIAAVIGPVLSGRTYRRLLYLVLAFPLTMLYWPLLGFGLLFGTLLSVVLVGIAVLGLMILVVRALVTLERGLANSLLIVSLEAPDDVTQSGGTGGDFRGYIDAASTWRGFGFLSLKGFLGIIGIMHAYGLAQGLILLSAGVRRPLEVSFGEVNGDPVIWTIESGPEAALATGAGAILVLFVLHLANGFGYVAERMALALLGDSAERPDAESAPAG